MIDPGFGRVFTDHMAIIEYDEEDGWHDARITARQPFTMDPASPVLHYAQEIFEGMKAYRRPDGGRRCSGPDANARRFAKSAIRMAMPPLPEEMFLESVRALVRADREWIPEHRGRIALPSPVHDRERLVPRNAAVDAVHLCSDRVLRRRLFQERACRASRFG